MTIKEAINIIRNYDVFGCGYCHQGGNEVEEAFGMTITTMQKYQKIEEIVADFNNQYNHRTTLDLMCEVKEVVEHE